MDKQTPRTSTPAGYPRSTTEYADPANKKYPVDTKEHARAAWSYINMPKNRAKYSSGELASIEAKIKRAAKKFGIDISGS